MIAQLAQGRVEPNKMADRMAARIGSQHVPRELQANTLFGPFGLFMIIVCFLFAMWLYSYSRPKEESSSNLENSMKNGDEVHLSSGEKTGKGFSGGRSRPSSQDGNVNSEDENKLRSGGEITESSESWSGTYSIRSASVLLTYDNRLSLLC